MQDIFKTPSVHLTTALGVGADPSRLMTIREWWYEMDEPVAMQANPQATFRRRAQHDRAVSEGRYRLSRGIVGRRANRIPGVAARDVLRQPVARRIVLGSHWRVHWRDRGVTTHGTLQGASVTLSESSMGIRPQGGCYSPVRL
jgi:hypothetical protein